MLLAFKATELEHGNEKNYKRREEKLLLQGQARLNTKVDIIYFQGEIFRQTGCI